MNFLKDLISDSKFTFLIGAGCSRDPPSNLPSAKEMIDALLEYLCPESLIQELMSLKTLRFEQLVQIIQETLDPDLRFIDYYAQCESPNSQHQFLANFLQKGHFVMTTNFDNLIELALASKIPKDEIKCIIKEDDFTKFSDPEDAFLNGFKVVYKIHGSVSNIITKEDTKDSLNATIKALGKNKEARSILELESFKQEFFKNITRNRTLIVLGYSGSDDFDIIPTLKRAEGLKSLIWINHIQDKSQEMQFQEIIINDKEEHSNDKLGRFLFDIKKYQLDLSIYRVEINTLKFIYKIFGSQKELQFESFNLKMKEWFKEVFGIISDWKKLRIAYFIFTESGENLKALECAEQIIEIGNESKDKTLLYLGSTMKGSIYLLIGKNSEALHIFNYLLTVAQSENLQREISNLYSNIASAHANMGNFDKALDYYKKIIEIERNLDRSKWQASHWNNIALLYNQLGTTDEAIKYYKESIQISEENGDIRGIANVNSNLGILYCDMGDFQTALDVLNRALEIFDKLNDYIKKATVLNNTGMVFHELKNYEIALKYYQESIELGIKFGTVGLADRFNNIGNIYKELGNEDLALRYFQDAIKYAKKNNEHIVLATLYNSIAQIYHDNGNFIEAIKSYEKSLANLKDAQDSIKKAITLSNLGELYYDTEKYQQALQNFEEALRIAKKNKDFDRLSYYEAFIAAIYEQIFEYKKAAKHLQNSIKALESQKKPDLTKLKGLIIRITRDIIPKIIERNYGRNEQCFCGSKKKYKDCHQKILLEKEKKSL